jgi:hypothetical protein
MLQCDADPNAEGCAVGGAPLTSRPLPIVKLVGGSGAVLTFALTETFPDAKPSHATAVLRFAAPPEVLNQIQVGDRDDTLDDRAAEVIAVGSRRSGSAATEVDVTLRLGADEDLDGTRYRGRVLKAGAPLTMTTERYVLAGTVLRVNREARAPE